MSMFGVTSAELAALSSGVSTGSISSIFPAAPPPNAPASLPGTQLSSNQATVMSTSSASELAIYSLIDELFVSVSEIKVALEQLLLKVDSCAVGSGVSPNVSSFLDSLSVVSGQMHMLCRKLSALNPSIHAAPSNPNVTNRTDSKYAMLSNISLYPRNLSVETDTHLMALTEDRARCFDHVLAPLYLRTKLIPSLESKLQVLADSADSAEKSDQLPFLLSCKDVVKRTVDELESLSQSLGMELASSDVTNSIDTCPISDTTALLAAVTDGRGLKSIANSPGGGGAMEHRRNFTTAAMAAQQQQMMSSQQTAQQQQPGSGGLVTQVVNSEMMGGGPTVAVTPRPTMAGGGSGTTQPVSVASGATIVKPIIRSGMYPK